MMCQHRQKGRRQSLLNDFCDQYGRDFLRHRSQLAMRAAKADAELAYRARGEFLANMNHELRTPLNAIIGFTQMIRDAEALNLDKEQTNEYADYILQSADLLLSHINTILELAAAESGGAKLRRKKIDPAELLEEIAGQMQAMAEAANIELQTRIDEDLPLLLIDPDMIEKAFRHLIENAIQYSPEGRHVVLHVRKGVRDNQRRRVYFAVEDQGPGMSEEELQRVMHAFEQVHQGLDRTFEGSGLGLPIARSFIELNGGSFHVKSLPGRGTIVRFSFPAILEQETPIEEQSAAEISAVS